VSRVAKPKQPDPKPADPKPADPNSPDDGAWMAVLVGVVAVPLVFAPFAADIFMLAKVLVATAAILVGWAAWFTLGRPLPKAPRVAIPVAVLLVSTALATAFSVAPRLSLVGVYQRYGGLGPLVVFVAFAALVVVTTWDRPDRLDALGRALGAVVLVVAVYALLQRAGLDAFDFREASGGRVRFPGSTLGNSNFAGGFLAVGLPFVAAFCVTARERRLRIAGLVGAVTVVAGLWATSSRGGIVAAAAGLAVAAILGRERLPRWSRPLTIVGAVAAAALVVVAVGVVATGARDVPGDDLEVLRSESARVRAFEWEAAVASFADRPLLGHGPDTFAIVYPQFRTAEDGAALGMQLSDKPHNVFLERAGATGIVGFAAYLVVVGTALGHGARRVRSAPAAETPTLLAFIGGLTAYLTQALFTIDVPPLAFVGWVLVGGLVTLADPAFVEARTAAVPRKRAEQRPRSRIPLVVAAGVAVLLLVPLGADTRLHFAENDDRDGDLATALDGYDAAVALYPFEAAYRRSAGFAAERLAVATDDRAEKKRLYNMAIHRYTEALDRQPDYVPFLVDLARVHVQRSREIDASALGDADSALTRAVQLDPHNWELRELHGGVLNAWANAGADEQRARAESEYEVLLELQPRRFDAWITLGHVRVALGDADGAREAAAQASFVLPFTDEAYELLQAADKIDADADE